MPVRFHADLAHWRGARLGDPLAKEGFCPGTVRYSLQRIFG